MSVIAALAVPHPPIILPEIGHGEEKKIAKTSAAYEAVMERAAALNPDLIVLTSPHSVMYSDYFHISPGKSASGDMGRFRADDVVIELSYDEEFVERLALNAEREGIPAGTLGERERTLDHGTIVPLYFLNKYTSDYKLVRIGLSGLPTMEHYRLGQCISKTADELDRRVLFIASGDLSHKLEGDGPYGFAPEGPEFDKQLTKALSEGDFLSLLSFGSEFSNKAAECGLRSFQIMAGALDRKSITHELLSYEGPFGVGYAVAEFNVLGIDETRNIGEQFEEIEREHLLKRKQNEDDYVKLARLSVETFIRSGKYAAMPEELNQEMLSKRAGTFVSLKKHGQLRGCIGTISAVTDNIAEEIMRNAVAAASQDPRFSAVTQEELPELVYSVDVLAQAERIDSPDELDVRRYGVIVEKDGRRGLLLPNLEGVDTVEEQINIAKRKAGIDINEKAELMRFEVVRHR